jgi:predicted  nucleic acid-binding Zn-ribbon protein
MSGRVRESKRKASALRDEERADALQIELDKAKKRYKTLHVLVCEQAQEIISLKTQRAALHQKVDGLEQDLYKATNE